MKNIPILDQIMARKREEVVERRHRTPEARLLERVDAALPTRDFTQALVNKVQRQEPAIIAEVKKASPSKGVIHPEHPPFDPVRIADGYARHGATCISCLTDVDFFQGADAYLARIHAEVAMPLLRKDFFFDPYQVIEARTLGADAILLIMAVLSVAQAQELEAAARELHLHVLVEVHNEAELEAAHELQTPLLGINNRDLRTFVTTLDTTLRLAGRADPKRCIISESGIRTFNEINILQENGIHAFLVGEALMRESDPGAALARLLGH
ncbi:MAG: indole-3-glycerol phosphate synthase TrpC [Magnetococcales bacterium]|nr:indole-3-glycerol phosphate synthase TrpC [Magnetococcales bacterium]